MFAKISAVWSLFRKGEQVADPAKWKNRQISATILSGVIMALVTAAKAFDYNLPIDEDSAMAIAGGVLAVVNIVLTIVTTKKIGLPSHNQAVDYTDPERPRNDR